MLGAAAGHRHHRLPEQDGEGAGERLQLAGRAQLSARGDGRSALWTWRLWTEALTPRALCLLSLPVPEHRAGQRSEPPGAGEPPAQTQVPPPRHLGESPHRLPRPAHQGEGSASRQGNDALLFRKNMKSSK